MATFWERAAHSINCMFSLLCLFVALVVSHFGFECSSDASVSGHCKPFIFHLLHNHAPFC